MANLETFKANLIKFNKRRAQQIRPRPRQQSLSELSLDAPPTSLVDLYCNAIQVWGTENILGDASMTHMQKCGMLDSFLTDFYSTLLSNYEGRSNRSSYWKPNVKMVLDNTIQVSLGSTVICEFK